MCCLIIFLTTTGWPTNRKGVTDFSLYHVGNALEKVRGKYLMSLHSGYLACARSCLRACGNPPWYRKVLSVAPWSDHCCQADRWVLSMESGSGRLVLSMKRSTCSLPEVQVFCVFHQGVVTNTVRSHHHAEDHFCGFEMALWVSVWHSTCKCKHYHDFNV